MFSTSKLMHSAAVAALCLTASIGATSAQEPKRGGILVFGQDEPPVHIDPQGVSMTSQTRIAVSVPYEALLRLDPEFNLLPSLATEWKEESPTSYLFTLRQGVKFHNGAPMTVDDVLFTFKRILDPARPSDAGGKMKFVDAVTAVDDKTIRITLKKPSAPFLRYMASPEITGIVNKAFTEANNNDLSNAVNGTGAFKVTRYQPSIIIDYTKFEDYWDPNLPYLDGVEIRSIPDESTRIAAMRTGEIQMTLFQSDKLRLMETVPNATIATPIQNGLLAGVLNCGAAPFDKLEVRQAMALAFDKTALMNTVLPGGLARPTMTITPADGVFGYQGDGSDLPYAKPDAEKAKQLLAAAGYPDGLDITIDYISSPAFAMDARTAEIVKEMAAPAGFRVKLNPLEYAAVFKRWVSGDFQMQFTGRGIEPDPDATFNESVSGSKLTRCPDPKVDEMVEAARTELDVAKRQKILMDVQRRIVEQAYFIYPYAKPLRLEMWSNNVKGYKPMPLLRRTYMRETWLDK